MTNDQDYIIDCDPLRVHAHGDCAIIRQSNGDIRKEAYIAGWNAAREKAKGMVRYCDCEITLDQDGVDHILGEIADHIAKMQPDGERVRCDHG